MDINFSRITPTFHEHEGYTYLEFEGSFFKGCKRCGGTGHFSFDGESSRCYNCNDTSAKLGEAFSSEAEAQKWCHGKAVRAAQASRKREEKQRMLEGMLRGYQAQLKESAPEVFEYLMGIDLSDYDQKLSPFIRSMAEATQWVGQMRLLSTNMIEAVRKVMAQTAERKAEAEAHPAPAGRVVVTGEIISAKLQESDFGTAYKILVKDDAGFKVWCSLPKAQADEAVDAFYSDDMAVSGYNVGAAVWFVGSSTEPEIYKGVKGKRITFTATLEPSKDDKGFAFGSRPTKGAWL